MDHFVLTLQKELPTRDIMTDMEFDEMMSIGLSQAKAGDSISCEDVHLQ